MEYVLGFAFDQNNSARVLMIRKNKPAWQRNKLNGVGGKIESSDKSPLAAMVREFKEETSIDSTEADWSYVTKMVIDLVDVVYVFQTHSLDIDLAVQATDEALEFCDVSDLQAQRLDTISNIPWLINLCFDADTFRRNITVHYSAVPVKMG